LKLREKRESIKERRTWLIEGEQRSKGKWNETVENKEWIRKRQTPAILRDHVTLSD
jgi:hypothetical protein